MGKKWKDILETLFGLVIIVIVGSLVWKMTLGMLISMMDEKYLRIGRNILVGLVAAVVIIVVIAMIIEHRRQKALAEKYRAVIGDCTLKELPEKLHQAGREALHRGELAKAGEYLEASAEEDIVKAGPDLIRYYHAVGKQNKAEELVKRLMHGDTKEMNIEAGLLAITLGLTDDPAWEMKCVKSWEKYRPEQKSQISKALWAEAEALVDQGVQQEKQEKLRKAADYCNQCLRDARKQADEGKDARAVEICAKALKNVSNDCRANLRDKLAELAWLAAQCSYKQKKYNDALKYLDMEDCSHYPSEYYLRLLAQTWDGSHVAYASMHEVEEAAKRAVREGIPGAEAMQVKLRNATIAMLDQMIRAEKANLADMEAEERFEAEHGISREEYAERQRQLAADRARAKREAQLRSDIELAERELDMRTGGSGRTVEERALAGEISFTDHALYEAAKKKFKEKRR